MSDESLLHKAVRIACEAHAGQSDKAGEPYLFHVFRVALAVETEEERAVAALHDVLEDTSVTLGDLVDAGLSADVVAAVFALSRIKRYGETYSEYIERVAANDLARRVKLADLADNLRPERISLLPPDEAASLSRRYHAAYRRLKVHDG